MPIDVDLESAYGRVDDLAPVSMIGMAVSVPWGIAVAMTMTIFAQRPSA